MIYPDIDRDRVAWQDDALCRQTDPDLFTPDGDENASYKQARRVCRQCPVAAECLTYAVEMGEVFGMWGGMTPHERRDLMSGRAYQWKVQRLEADRERDDRLLPRYERMHMLERADLAREMGVSTDVLNKRMSRARDRRRQRAA